MFVAYIEINVTTRQFIMRQLFRGKLSPIGVAILTAEIVLLSGCGNGSSGKSSFWRMPTNEETSESESDPWAEDEELFYDDSSRANSYSDRQHVLSPEENREKVSPGIADRSSNNNAFFSRNQDADSTSSDGMPTTATAAGDWGAISAYSEIAPRNFRGSGTYGVYLTSTQRFKLSGEYLAQNLDFHFNSGHHKKWVSQVAFGAEYQYLLDNDRFKSIELGTAYSHAFRTHHNISGSNGSLSFLGTTARLWNCAFLSVAAEYDWVEFDRKHRHDKSSNGFGGSVDFVQQFGKDFSLNLGAQFREPFNSYQGLVNWNHRFCGFNLDIGVFGNLTEGHDGVRDIRTVGLQLGIAFGPKAKNCGRCVEMSDTGRNCYARQYCDVSQWVSRPAVYVPVVLVIADPQNIPSKQCIGTPPTLTGTFIDVFFPADAMGPVTTQIAMAPAFSSPTPLTYSLVIDPATPLPPGASLTIDPATGVLTGVNPNIGATIHILITATNECGQSVVLNRNATFSST